jgi:Raf kinase inhibitor-like YbhB/YbcL family protein
MNKKYYILFVLLILLCSIGQAVIARKGPVVNEAKWFFISTAHLFTCSTTILSEENKKAMVTVTSPVFKESGMIPAKYTCDGTNVSPPLAWQRVPQGTKSFALICDDPDAPVGIWVHWVVWNIPAEANGLAENIPAKKELPDGSKQGITSTHKSGYHGPCPPGGIHRYYFKIYALDAALDLPDSTEKQGLLDAAKGHILAEGALMGRYERQKP